MDRPSGCRSPTATRSIRRRATVGRSSSWSPSPSAIRPAPSIRCSSSSWPSPPARWCSPWPGAGGWSASGCARWRTSSAPPTPSRPATSTSASRRRRHDRGRPTGPRPQVMLERIEAAFAARLASEARLKESDRHLRQFVADASHELRTPIAAVAAYAELFERGASTNAEDLPRVISGIRTETGRMERLVTDLLELARLDEGLAPPDTCHRTGRPVRRSGAHRHHRGPALAGDVHRRAPGRGAGRSRPVAPGGRQSPGQCARPHPGGHHGHGARRSGRADGPGGRPRQRARHAGRGCGPGVRALLPVRSGPGPGPAVARASDSPSSRPSSSPTAAPSRPSRPPAAA